MVRVSARIFNASPNILSLENNPMKKLDDSLTAVRKQIHGCFIHPDSEANAAIKDLIYCSTIFIAEATRAACGLRASSSKRVALELAAKRGMRIRLYKR